MENILRISALGLLVFLAACQQSADTRCQIGFTNASRNDFSNVGVLIPAKDRVYDEVVGLLWHDPSGNVNSDQIEGKVIDLNMDTIPSRLTVYWATDRGGPRNEQVINVPRYILSPNSFVGTLWFWFTDDGVEVVPESDAEAQTRANGFANWERAEHLDPTKSADYGHDVVAPAPPARPRYSWGFNNPTGKNLLDISLEYSQRGEAYAIKVDNLPPSPDGAGFLTGARDTFGSYPVPEMVTVRWKSEANGPIHTSALEVASQIPDIVHYTTTIWLRFSDEKVELVTETVQQSAARETALAAKREEEAKRVFQRSRLDLRGQTGGATTRP